VRGSRRKSRRGLGDDLIAVAEVGSSRGWTGLHSAVEASNADVGIAPAAPSDFHRNRVHHVLRRCRMPGLAVNTTRAVRDDIEPGS